MLAAITCHFNPIQYDNILRNYWMFREALKGVDLFTIELSFNGEFAIEDAIHVEGQSDLLYRPRFRGRKPELRPVNKGIMWQKERLLNLLIDQLPNKYDQVAWLDGDIIFDNVDWAADTARKLDEFPMVQLFENGYTTNSQLELTRKIPGMVYAGVETKNARPGLAWAARRSILAKTGLLDTHIMGGGDNMMYFAAMGFFNTYMLSRTNIAWRRAYLEWAAPFYREIKGNLSYIEGDVVHLYHGTYADRQYVERWIVLSRNAFDPTNDIRINKAGIWEWASDKPELHYSVAEYFEERKEDEEEISERRKTKTKTKSGLRKGFDVNR